MWIECGKMCIAVNKRMFHQAKIILWQILAIQELR